MYLLFSAYVVVHVLLLSAMPWLYWTCNFSFRHFSFLPLCLMHGLSCAWDSITWTWQELSISTLVLRDCLSHSFYWVGDCFSQSPPLLFCLPKQLIGHVSYEEAIHRHEKMNWAYYIPYILRLSTERFYPERTVIYGTSNETKAMYQLPYIWGRVGSLGVLASQSYDKVQMWRGNYEVDKRYAE